MSINLKRKTYRDKSGQTRRTKTYYLVQGSRWISTGKQTRDAAEKWARDYLGRNSDGQRAKRRQQKLRKAPLSQHVTRWCEALRESGRLREDWIDTKVRRVDNLLDWTGWVRLSDLDADQLVRVLNARINSGRFGPKTVNAYKTEAKAFTDFLVADNVLQTNPLRAVGRDGKPIIRSEKVRASDRKIRRRYLRQEELSKLIRTTKRKGKTVQGISATDRAMAYRLAAGSGLRRKEVASLTPESFDLQRPSVYLAPEDSKNDEGAHQPLPEWMVPRLEQWLADKPASGPVLPIRDLRTGEMIASDLSDAGIPVIDRRVLKVDFHALRYTYVALLALAGVPIAQVSKLARHSTITLTVDTYLKLGLDDHGPVVNELPEV